LDDRKELKKRVSNGDDITTAEEATLSKLSAVHESKKKQNRDSYKSKLDDRKVLEKRVSNGEKLDTAEGKVEQTNWSTREYKYK
jgi:hypothetical protein